MLILDEPTRGIDVGTKAEVHRLISELAGARRRRPDDLDRAARGARHGRPRARHARGPPAAELTRAEADEERVMRAATGQTAEAAA